MVSAVVPWPEGEKKAPPADASGTTLRVGKRQSSGSVGKKTEPRIALMTLDVRDACGRLLLQYCVDVTFVIADVCYCNTVST